MKEILARQLRYEHWANRRTLESLKQIDDPERAGRLFGHILAAQETWLRRLAREGPPTVEMFPVQSLAEYEQRMESLASRLNEHLDSLNEDGLREPVTYERRPGESFTNTRYDILHHLLTHSHYHRGQIAARLRALGATPAQTDFIFYVREGN